MIEYINLKSLMGEINAIIEDNKNLKLTLDQEIKSSIELLKKDTNFYLDIIKDLKKENNKFKSLVK